MDRQSTLTITELVDKLLELKEVRGDVYTNVSNVFYQQPDLMIGHPVVVVISDTLEEE